MQPERRFTRTLKKGLSACNVLREVVRVHFIVALDYFTLFENPNDFLGAILTASLSVEPTRDFPSELSCKTLKKLASQDTQDNALNSMDDDEYLLFL